MVTFFLIGGLRTIVHLEISGSWSCRTRIVFLVAVAVIINIFPSKLLSSPVDSAIAGRKADLESLLSPQLATAKFKFIRNLNLEYIEKDSDVTLYFGSVCPILKIQKAKQVRL